MLSFGQVTRVAVTGRPDSTGHTLIEVGLVIILLSSIAVLMSDYYLNYLRTSVDNRRVSDTVRDMQLLLDASVLWREQFGEWPHNEEDEFDSWPLISDGYLTDETMPANRFAECRPTCADYSLRGWDRGFENDDGTFGNLTDLVSEAEDLVIELEVPTLSAALRISAQLPLGVYDEPASGGEFYTVRTRLFPEASGLAYELAILRCDLEHLQISQWTLPVPSGPVTWPGVRSQVGTVRFDTAVGTNWIECLRDEGFRYRP